LVGKGFFASTYISFTLKPTKKDTFHNLIFGIDKTSNVYIISPTVLIRLSFSGGGGKRSKSRGKLFYRLVQQAMVIAPMTGKDIGGAKAKQHNTRYSLYLIQVHTP
jgi:hypothetical protein